MFASKEYKEALKEAEQVESINVSEKSNNLSELRKAKDKIDSSLNDLKQLSESNNDSKLTEKIQILEQKQSAIQKQIENLEAQQREEEEKQARKERFNQLKPYLCKGTISHATKTYAEIIKIDNQTSPITLSYTRPEDKSQWSYQCQISKTEYKPDMIQGNIDFVSKAPDASDYKEFDSDIKNIRFEVNDKENETLITITEKLSDNYSTKTTFKEQELK